LKRVAKTQNAHIINDISRPVTGPLPDHTRRKLDAQSLERAQSSAIDSLLGSSHQDVTDDSEDDTPAWIGTSLHGLMENPRKASTSLTKISTTSLPTKRETGRMRPQQKSSNYPKVSHSTDQGLRNSSFDTLDSVPTASEDDEDDLDAPLRSPTSCTLPAKELENSMPKDTRVLSTGKPIQRKSVTMDNIEVSEPPRPNQFDPVPSIAAPTRTSRLEKARARIAEELSKQKSWDSP
jgi:hypothetical protein